MEVVLALFAVVFTGATLFALVGWSLRSAVDPVFVNAAPAWVHADARIVFCEPELERAAVTVDAVAVPDGTPFSMRLRSPQTMLFRDLTMAVFSDWAADEALIDVEFSPDGRRANLGTGTARFCLELESLSGLGRGSTA